MNGNLPGAIDLIEGIKQGNPGDAELAVCPPAVFLMKAGGMLDGSTIALGAQNVCNHESGAYTGEVNEDLLRWQR